MAIAGKISPGVHKERRLGLREVLQDLAQDGLITVEQARTLLNRQNVRSVETQHPLVTVSQCEWTDARKPVQKLSLEFLAQWLAERNSLAYHRIDPLTIDVSSITAVTTYAYAARAGILPIKVTQTEITVATAQPFLHEWERELRQVTKKDIQRVVANPLDIDRYLVEFYALARSVKASSEQHKARLPGVSNLEQLVDLGQRQARRQRPARRPASSTGCGNTPSSSAPATSTSSRGATQGIVRFRIDGVLHQVYQIPAVVMTAR